MKNLGLKNFNIYIQYLIGLAVIIFLIYHIQSKENLLTVLNQFDIDQIIPAFIIICIHLLCLFFMWRIIVLNVGQIDPGYKTLLHSFFGGRTLGFISPGQTGDLLKGMFFTSGSRLKGTSLSMIFAGYNMLIRTVLGIIACLYFILYMPDSIQLDLNNSVAFIFFIAMVIFLVLFSYHIQIKEVIIKYFPRQVASLLKLFNNHLKSESFHQFIILISIALMANLLSVLAFMIILYGFNINVISFKGLMAFEAAYFAMSLLPVTPSGIGIREGSRVYFFALIGCSKAAVICASFIIFTLNIILPAIIGIGSIRYFWNKEPDHS